MPKKRLALSTNKVGDITAVSLGDDTYCYVRKYAFGHGVLPFLSKGLELDASKFPSLTPAFHMHIWVYNIDPTPMCHVAHVPFATEEESWGVPAYYPPDLIEDCYRIHGIFHGMSRIIKPVTEADVAGLEEFRRYQPPQFREHLFSRLPEWTYITGSSAISETVNATEEPAATAFYEIVFQAADFTFGGRDEVEDPLDEALRESDLGEVTGGGSGGGICHIDVEVKQAKRGLALIRKVLRKLKVARSTRIHQTEPEPREFGVYP